MQIIDGEVFINDKKLIYKKIGVYRDNNLVNRKKRALGCRNEDLEILTETLPNGRSYEILNSAIESYADNTGVYNVPENHFFMMGDNRDNSQDSRYLKSVGFVPFNNLVGRAELIFFSWNWKKMSKPNCVTSIEWSRIFQRIK